MREIKKRTVRAAVCAALLAGWAGAAVADDITQLAFHALSNLVTQRWNTTFLHTVRAAELLVHFWKTLLLHPLYGDLQLCLFTRDALRGVFRGK